MEELSKHEQKELKKQQHEQESQKQRESLDKEKRNIKIIKYSLIAVPILIFIFFIFYLVRSPATESYTKGEVHWHASLTVSTCGQIKNMPKPFGSEHHLGLPLLHTHDDGLIHIEGKVWKKEDIMLGKYFEVLNLNFKDKELFEYKNGDNCNDKEGKVKLYVNGKENSELTKYVIQDKDKLEVKFE